MEAAQTLPSPGLGQISISGGAVAQVAGHVAAECYGIVGMRACRRVRLPRRLRGKNPARGVEVSESPAGLSVTLHVVVEYGLNLAEVAATLRSRVAYEVERLTGLNVAEVDVHIADVRRS